MLSANGVISVLPNCITIDDITAGSFLVVKGSRLSIFTCYNVVSNINFINFCACNSYFSTSCCCCSRCSGNIFAVFENINCSCNGSFGKSNFTLFFNGNLFSNTDFATIFNTVWRASKCYKLDRNNLCRKFDGTFNRVIKPNLTSTAVATGSINTIRTKFDSYRIDIINVSEKRLLNLPRLKSQGSWELSPNGKIFTKLSP